MNERMDIKELTDKAVEVHEASWREARKDLAPLRKGAEKLLEEFRATERRLNPIFRAAFEAKNQLARLDIRYP